jgi:predicted nucleic acid-binding protein
VVVVADSSPLIYFSRVGVLDVLAAVYGDIVVPRAVLDEVVHRRPSSPGIQPAGSPQSHQDRARGPHARQVGAIPALRPVIDALIAEGFRIAPALIRAALSQVGELAE